MTTTAARVARVMTEADERLQDSGFDGAQSRAVILSAVQIVDEAIRHLATSEALAETNRRLARVEEAVSALREETGAGRKEAGAAREEAAAAHKEAVAAREEAAAAHKEAVAAREEAAAAHKEAVAARQEAAAARKAASAACEAAKTVAANFDKFRDQMDTFKDQMAAEVAAEMAKGFARMSRQLWVMVGATAAIILGIVRLLW